MDNCCISFIYIYTSLTLSRYSLPLQFRILFDFLGYYHKYRLLVSNYFKVALIFWYINYFFPTFTCNFFKNIIFLFQGNYSNYPQKLNVIASSPQKLLPKCRRETNGHYIDILLNTFNRNHQNLIFPNIEFIAEICNQNSSYIIFSEDKNLQKKIYYHYDESKPPYSHKSFCFCLVYTW